MDKVGKKGTAMNASWHWALGDLPVSGIREILGLALARPGTLRLETGEPDFPPPSHVIEAFHEAALAGKNHYTPTVGIEQLREALAQKIWRVNHVRREPDDILVTPGGIPGLFLSFMGTLATGDEVLIPDPGWPDYLAGVKSLGGVVVPYPLEFPGLMPDVEVMERLVSPRTRALVVNFPGNPTGVIPPRSVIEDLVALARRHGLWIISDEVYDEIVFTPEGPFSPARLAPDITFQIFSFSKTYAMTGWRLGYMAGPRVPMESLARVAAGAWSSVSEPLQYAGLAALAGPETMVVEMRDRYRERRDAATHLLNGELGLDSTHPEGAFYLLVDVRQAGLDSRTLALELLDRYQVAVAPGSAFGRMSSHHVRLSLASHRDVLLEGARRLAHLVQERSVSS